MNVNLKIEELAVGNIVRLVKHPNKPLVVITNTSYGHYAPCVNVSRQTCGISNEPYYVDDIEPVQITEDICEKLGFTTNGDHTLTGAGYYGLMSGDTHVELRPRACFLRIKYHDDRWYTNLETSYCKYLHQLQNYLSASHTLQNLIYLSKLG